MIESKLPHIGTTIFTRMSGLADECGALNLSQGFPDFDAPEPLREAMARHVMAGHNQYAPMAGVMQLREQLAAQLALHRHIQTDPDTEITVVPGATEGIFCAVMACVRPGDEVIVFDPCYDSYQPAVELAGGRAVHVPLTPGTFALDRDRLEAEPHYPATLAAFYQRKRDLFCAALGDSRFTLSPSSGTYFQLLDYNVISEDPDTTLCEQWTRQHGIASIPISIFYEQPPHQHFLRFCFAKSDPMLTEAAERLCKI